MPACRHQQIIGDQKDEHRCLEQTFLLRSSFSPWNQRVALENHVLRSESNPRPILSPPAYGWELRSIEKCFFFETTWVSTMVFEKAGVASLHHQEHHYFPHLYGCRSHFSGSQVIAFGGEFMFNGWSIKCEFILSIFS